MKLTDENQDYMDCLPLNRNTGIAPHPELEAAIAEQAAKRQENMMAEKDKTEQGAPTDKAEKDAGDGTLTGSVPAGLTVDELKKQAERPVNDDGSTG